MADHILAAVKIIALEGATDQAALGEPLDVAGHQVVHDCTKGTVHRPGGGRHLALVFGIWMMWITWTAFAGDQAPDFPIAFDEVSIERDLLWLLISDSIVVTVAYWIFMLVMLPVIRPAAGVGALADRRRHD